jgi:hypothetical protein
MTTTAFQFVFDRAESIQWDKTATVAQTISRDNTVRSVSRGGQTWRFTVRLPDGMPWQEMRPLIEEAMAADRVTVGNVQINQAGYNTWLNNYQGNCADRTSFVATATQGWANVTLTANAAITSGSKFRAGDIIQLGGAGNVYTVANTVSSSSNTVYLNRAVVDATGSYALRVGPDVYWQVICTQLPTYTITGYKQVTWSGEFVFYEARA